MRGKLALVAVLLWGVTLAGFGLAFVRGNTSPGTDGRTSVRLAPAERDFVLAEMRRLLASMADIEAGLAAGDAARVAAAAAPLGGSAAEGAPPALLVKLPLDFKRQAMALHGGFDAIAVAARKGEATQALSNQMAEQIRRCSACHEAYRFDAGS